MRPRQWTKNLLVFAGIVFAAKLGDPGRWADAAIAFAAFCAGSSAAYLVNDVRDVAHDRLHPTKSARPVARGELAPRIALALAAGLALIAAALGQAEEEREQCRAEEQPRRDRNPYGVGARGSANDEQGADRHHVHQHDLLQCQRVGRLEREERAEVEQR